MFRFISRNIVPTTIQYCLLENFVKVIVIRSMNRNVLYSIS